MRTRNPGAFVPLIVLGLALPLSGQQEPPKPLTDELPQRELSEKERQKREKALRKELEKRYKSWLQEDVVYIITPEEREAFEQLGTEEEREAFIEQFWLRRDPTPDTLENEYKEEHYRRIAYANERFSSGIRGWESDRGRVYIIYGPPDEIEGAPAGGMYDRPLEEGGGATMVHAYEKWRYRNLEGIGTNVILEFVDITGSGEYRLTMDPSEKDALLEIPGAGLSLTEQSGLARKRDRFLRLDGTRLPRAPYQTKSMEPFERLERLARIQQPPPVKFKDLEEVVNTRISFNLLPFDLRADFLRITDETVLVPLTFSLRKKDLMFREESGVHHATVNVFGRITTLGGRIVQIFEDVIQLDVPASLLEETLQQQVVYQKALPLSSGLYRMSVVLKDLNSGNLGVLERRLAVPRFEGGKLEISSLILADQIERVPAKEVGRGPFVLGGTKVRPAVREEFRPNDRVGVYLQVYNLSIDPKTQKPYATVSYSVHRGGDIIFNQIETTADMKQAGQQLTLEKRLGLGSLQPGEYKLKITITDWVQNATVTASSPFRVVP
ncbi:MAG TPA: GWxTD domain-containing protein [Candidatus Xenobia bacterium]|nr:GWxTD domain-containing protein [Candidatus Xenobia bacterium]